MTYTKIQKNPEWYHSCHKSFVRKQCSEHPYTKLVSCLCWSVAVHITLIGYFYRKIRFSRSWAWRVRSRLELLNWSTKKEVPLLKKMSVSCRLFLFLPIADLRSTQWLKITLFKSRVSRCLWFEIESISNASHLSIIRGKAFYKRCGSYKRTN